METNWKSFFFQAGKLSGSFFLPSTCLSIRIVGSKVYKLIHTRFLYLQTIDMTCNPFPYSSRKPRSGFMNNRVYTTDSLKSFL